MGVEVNEIVFEKNVYKLLFIGNKTRFPCKKADSQIRERGPGASSRAPGLPLTAALNYSGPAHLVWGGPA